MKNYVSNSRELARKLRKTSTNAEKYLWKYIRNKQISGKRFLRQFPLSFVQDENKRFFIVDFYCPERRLAVEVDGMIHDQDFQKAYDLKRCEILESIGVRVLRFTNDEVLQNLDSVLDKLKKSLPLPRLPLN